MNWVNSAYQHQLSKYQKEDGFKALVVYGLMMASAFFQGWLYTTNVPVLILDSSQIWIPVVMSLVFFVYTKQNLRSVGIHADHLVSSLLLGLLGGCLLLSLQAYFLGKRVYLVNPDWFNWLIFLLAAFEEEVCFRAYIQTRLSGLIKSQWIVGLINSLLFLSIHYPVKWVLSGTLSFDALPMTYVLSLIALHYFCDVAIRKPIVCGDRLVYTSFIMWLEP